jgi:hypothetical protein
MLYAAKCYWPGVSEAGLKRAGEHMEDGDVSFLGSLLFPGDELVLCFFEAESGTAVKQASERMGFPCERVMPSVWLAPRGQERSAAH